MERVFHLTSGELAELVGVTKQTVLYYDKVGLLCPKGRMSNRYRYYSLQQAAELRLILTFRELGMSIQEIRDYLQVRTPEAYLQVLGEQQKRLQAEAARLQRMQERVARERRQLSQAMAEGGGSICLCWLPAHAGLDLFVSPRPHWTAIAGAIAGAVPGAEQTGIYGVFAAFPAVARAGRGLFTGGVLHPTSGTPAGGGL